MGLGLTACSTPKSEAEQTEHTKSFLQRYDVISGRYGQKPSELGQGLKSITERISEMGMGEMCIREFLDKAKSYIEMPNPTPKLLRVFIRRVEVYEKFENYSRACGNPIVIHLVF